MGCIHVSRISPEDTGRAKNQNTKGKNTTRSRGLWRRFRRNRILPTEIVGEEEPNVSCTVAARDNRISPQDDLLRDKLGPCQKDVKNKLDPCQNDVPLENLNLWNNDVLQEDVLQEDELSSQNDIAQGDLIPWENDILQDNGSPGPNIELQDSLGPSQSDHLLQENAVSLQIDVVEENLDDVVHGTKQMVDLQLGQRPGEEAFDHAQDTEDTVTDSLREAGPLERDIVNAYLDGVLPSYSNENNHDRAESYPVDPYQNDLPLENLNPCNNDVLQEDELSSQNDIIQGDLIPWENDILQDNGSSGQNIELQDSLGPSQSDHLLQENAVSLQIDVVEENLDDVVQGTQQMVDLQLGQQPGEEAFDHAQDTEDTDTDSLCEAGPLEREIVSAYLDGVLPSYSDDNTDGGAESSPVDSYQHHTPTCISNQLRPILKKPGSMVLSGHSHKKVSFSASTMDVKTTGPDNAIKVPALIVEIPRCTCVGCITGCEEPELPQSIATSSDEASIKTPQIQLARALPRPSGVSTTARNTLSSAQANSQPSHQASCSLWEPSTRKDPIQSYNIRMSAYWSKLGFCDRVSRKRIKALQEIKRLSNPTLVQKYAKLHTNKFLLDDG